MPQDPDPAESPVASVPPHLDPEAARIGPDVVRFESGVVMIYSRRNMPDWVVREFKRPVIWFKETKFFLRAKNTAAPPFRWRYTLWPWTDDDCDPANYDITYDENYVQERELGFRDQARTDGIQWLLVPLVPFMGFLWSGVKDRLGEFGFDARSTTALSLILQAGVAFMWLIFLALSQSASVLDLLGLVTLAADIVFRYDAVLAERLLQPGFLEWCFRRPSA